VFNVILAVLIIGPAVVLTWHVTMTRPERRRPLRMDPSSHVCVRRPHAWEPSAPPYDWEAERAFE